ncbi:hypothetical protein MAPG_12040 [Magnaporthiopsis poae ATCC 64411]|uniref:Uncharacterized protein n=1 Tax=Magnaporthiopsis poae (strain ATCC 64411 / 73-15) TaxID=644358 RepID=A0A0C4EGQ3_MAGP6|nr:hypothetical protein MAPG_12040 [Magnaporthiopsis poae ATCC 64411]
MPLTRILLGAAALAGGSYLCAVAIALAPASNLDIQATLDPPADFKSSRAFVVANPHKHKGSTEALWTTIRVPAGLADGKIITRFLRGFFYGAVIFPERVLIDRLYGREIVNFQCPGAASAVNLNLRTASSLPAEGPPPVGSKLWGTFQVLDSEQGSASGALSAADTSQNSSSTSTQVFVDLGFGFNGPRSIFAGMHRVAVVRQPASGDGEAVDTVTVSYLAHACNPSEDRPVSALLFAFHRVYARLLFRNGVAAVLAISNSTRC